MAVTVFCRQAVRLAQCHDHAHTLVSMHCSDPTGQAEESKAAPGAKRKKESPGGQRESQKVGEACLLTVGAFSLTVKLLCLQSLKALIRRTFPTVSKKAPTVSKKAKIVSKKAPTVSKKAKIVNCKKKAPL